jgi:hypothetical protein
MDAIRFEVLPNPSTIDDGQPGLRSLGIQYLINGRDLLEMVRDIEAPFAAREGHPDIAGGYGALPLREFEDAPRYFLGDAGEGAWPGPPWTNLYVCGSCGVAECWPLYVQIQSTNDSVRWHSFRQPHRDKASAAGRSGRHWQYDQLGPFTFDRTMYEREVDRLNLRLGPRP